MSALDWEQVGAIVDALFVLIFFTIIFAHWVARWTGDLIGWALSRSPSWRSYRRKRNRLERMEFAAYLRERRERLADIEARTAIHRERH